MPNIFLIRGKSVDTTYASRVDGTLSFLSPTTIVLDPALFNISGKTYALYSVSTDIVGADQYLTVQLDSSSTKTLKDFSGKNFQIVPKTGGGKLLQVTVQ